MEIKAITLYGESLDKFGDSEQFRNINDDTIYLVQNMQDKLMSSDFFSTTEKVSKTALATVLLGAGIKPFTVVFLKQDGSERELKGILVSSDEHLLGRVRVEDFAQPKGERLRLVDLRTLQSVVVGGVKYVLK